jgi:hypothetical protein
MPDIYDEMIAACGKIAASFPAPSFYTRCAPALDFSRALFVKEDIIGRCREIVRRRLENNLGHGMEHAETVALEAGALANLEAEGLTIPAEKKREASVLAQIAGLLHDVRRNEKDHAQAGAEEAAKILEEFSITRENARDVAAAIANHEAFTEPRRIDSGVGRIISDSLYDADKFRWGPDNFTTTLWYMLRSRQAPIVRMIRRYSKGMQGIERIKNTFRTEAGKTYGPEFIDLGLRIGERIYEYLQTRFAEELAKE